MPPATFRCGHPRTIANTVWRKRTGAAAKRLNPYSKLQAICRTCHRKKQAEAQRRRRAQAATFTKQVYDAAPVKPDLPAIERCKDK